MKDSSGDLNYLRDAVELARVRPDFSVLIGPEAMFAEALTFGVHGGVAGGGNVFPEFFVELWQAYVRGDQAAAATWQSRIVRLQDLYRISPHPSCVIQGVKAGLALRGICTDRLATSLQPLRGADLERAREIVAELEEVATLS